VACRLSSIGVFGVNAVSGGGINAFSNRAERRKPQLISNENIGGVVTAYLNIGGVACGVSIIGEEKQA